jgi:hypothetical protein
VPFTKYYSGAQIKDGKMGGSCSMNDRDEKRIIVLLENLKRRDHSEDLGVDGRIILEWILRKWGWKT